MRNALAASAADRRLLPEGRLAGPMPWVIAIMTFLSVLTAAGGLALGGAARGLGRDLAGKATVEIVEADPVMRERQARTALAELQRLSGVAEAERVDEARLKQMLAPWLGKAGLDAGLPVPALIDVRLRDGASLAPVADAMRAAAPAARVEAHDALLGPLTSLLSTLRWTAAALIALVAAATAAAVVLSARAALNTHRATIDTMHMMGASDAQIARLFQRRAALDAAFGGAIGLAAGVTAVVVVARRFAAIDAALIGGAALSLGQWLLIFALPLAGVGIAILAARLTVLRALAKML